MYTLDTNVIIYYLLKESLATAKLNSILAGNNPIYISTITELELFAYPQLSIQEARLIKEILLSLNIIPIDSRIAQIAGRLKALNKVKLADSVIAATALATGTTLLTRNTKDFKNISNLTLEKI